MLGSPANVTYKIQYKCPDFNFSKAFYKLSNQNIPMAEILSELKKRRHGILAFNINEGSWGDLLYVEKSD